MSGARVRPAPDWRPARGAARAVLPVIEGDPGPAGVGRGAVEATDVLVQVYDPREDAHRMMPQRVARRADGHGLRALPPELRDVARLYATLVERRGAIACRDMVTGGGGGCLSDGGAVARLVVADRVAALRAAVGPGEWRGGARGQGDRVQAGARIPVVALVDAVCLDGASLRDVLRRYGWQPGIRAWRDELGELLREAVGRMADMASIG